MANSDYENNISATLNHIMDKKKKSANQLTLICGSFFIMTDVRDHFGVQRSEQADEIA